MIGILIYLVFALAFTAWAVHIKRSRKLTFLIMTISLLVLGFWAQGCICSVGSIQNVIEALLGNPVGLTVGVLLLFAIPIIASFLWGRVFCGGVCPLGAMQDIVNVTRIRFPKWIDVILKTLPLVVLGVVTVGIIRGDGYLLCKYDFLVPFFRFTATGTLLIVGLAGVLLSMVLSRPLCKYLCPYGAVLGAAAWFAPRKVDITPSKCTKCTFCGDVCVVGAIDRPAELIAHESPRTGKIWMILAIALIPLWSIGFSKAAAGISVSPEKIEKIGALREKEELSPKQQKKLDGLVIAAKESQQKGAAAGAVFGVLWGGMFLMLTRRKTNPFYLADKMTCVACGRCYNHCPQSAPKREARLFDTVLGHVRLRKSSEKAPDPAEPAVKPVKKMSSVRLSGILNHSALLIGAVLIIITGAVILNDQAIRSSEPGDQPILENLSSALRDTPESEEIRSAYTELNSAMQTKHFSSTNRNVPLMIVWLVLVILLAGILKYRHNRFVVPAMKPSLNRDQITMLSVLLARIGVLSLGAGLMALAFRLGTTIPL